jgi:alcohol dehydrogenase class IV
MLEETILDKLGVDVGRKVVHMKTVTEADIAFTAGATGDFNLVHTCEEFAKKTGLPQKLSQVNIPRENMLEVAKLALGDPGMKSNLRRVTDPQEIVPVLLAAW